MFYIFKKNVSPTKSHKVIVLLQSVTVEYFFNPVSSLKVFGHSIHSERRRIYPGKSTQALQNDTIIIPWLFSFRIIQPRCGGILKKLLFVFMFSFSLQNLYKVLFSFSLQNLYKVFDYLINVKPITSSLKIQTKIFTWPNMPFYAR